MTRILLPTLDYPPKRGGVARYLSAIAQTFSNVEVLVWDAWPGYFNALRQLWSRRHAYDRLLVSHVLPVGTAAWLLRPFTRKDYVVILHGMDFDLARRSAWKRWVTKRVLGCRAIVVNSQALADEVRAFVGPSTPIHVVHPCVSDAFVESAHVFSNHPPSPMTHPPTLLTVGRLVERKGFLKVLNLLPSLPDVRYRIIGDGPLRNQILNHAKNLGVADRVEVVQSVSDGKLPDIYRQADVFVMPTTKTETDREGFGIVYLEAQLFSLPVVATRQPGVDEAVEGGETGVLIDDTEMALKHAITTLLGDAELRRQMGERGRRRVLEGFTRQHSMRKLESVL